MLPILPLPSPVVLLPTSKITIPITTSQADSLIALQQSNHSNVILAVVPLVIKESNERSLNEWGVTARILRLFNASFRPGLAGNLDSAPRYQFLLSLHALDRIRLSKPLPAPAALVLQHPIHLPASGPSPDPGTVDTFRGAARRIIDLRLRSEDGARREAWSQIADMLDGDSDANDRDDEQSAWIADVLVAGLKLDHADKLGQSPFLALLIYGIVHLT
jgi:ATP-dependent Lon protease